MTLSYVSLCAAVCLDRAHMTVKIDLNIGMQILDTGLQTVFLSYEKI